MSVTRSELQELARARLREARSLLQARLFDGAYYLAGLCVECALKACIARQTRRFDFPDKNVVLGSYTHDLARLLRTAGLEAALDRESLEHPALGANWATVKDWRVDSRYARMSRRKAQQLYRAVAAKRAGVLSWIRQHW